MLPACRGHSVLPLADCLGTACHKVLHILKETSQIQEHMIHEMQATNKHTAQLSLCAGSY